MGLAVRGTAGMSQQLCVVPVITVWGTNHTLLHCSVSQLNTRLKISGRGRLLSACGCELLLHSLFHIMFCEILFLNDWSELAIGACITEQALRENLVQSVC